MTRPRPGKPTAFRWDGPWYLAYRPIGVVQWHRLLVRSDGSQGLLCGPYVANPIHDQLVRSLMDVA